MVIAILYVGRVYKVNQGITVECGTGRSEMGILKENAAGTVGNGKQKTCYRAPLQFIV